MAEILTNFLIFQTTIKVYHWNTTSHSRHVASGELYEEISELIDEFMEVYMGTKRIVHGDLDLHIRKLSNRNAIPYLRSFIVFLNGLDKLSPDLSNIRDEMMAVVHRTIYKFAQSG